MYNDDDDALCFIANVYILHTLHSIELKACKNLPKMPIQFTRAESEGVPLLRFHQDLQSTSGDHIAILAVGIVLSLRHALPVVVEVGIVVHSVNTGPQTEADPPGPCHGHSENACNEKKLYY